MTQEEKPILNLVLKGQWFNMIGQPKDEEYRIVSEYWSRVFCNGKIKIKRKFYHPSDVIVCFSHGYKKDRSQKFYNIINVTVGAGKPEWGAELNTQYFIIKIDTKLLKYRL